MTRLVADIGGTNCRVAQLGIAGQPLQAVQSYRNDDFASFQDLLQQYLINTAQPDISEMVLALAGPVSSHFTDQTAQITNRNWQLSAQALSRDMQGIPVHFLNDLSALGHGIQELQQNDVDQVLPADEVSSLEQKLVVGIGTGFNVSPVITADDGVNCLKTEYGHVSLPVDLYQMLQAQIGPGAQEFKTVECCFSGRGFAALFAAFAPQNPCRNPAEIMTAQQVETAGFVDFYARLMALLCRNLLKGFLPRGGIYFAGTVARSLLTGPGRAAFLEAYTRPDPKFPEITAPVYCILDDGAALKGCAVFRVPQT